MRLMTLVLLVFGATNVARAQEAPTLREDTKLTDEAMEHARRSPGLQVNPVNTAYPRLTLHEGPRHPRRGQRLVRTGGLLMGLGTVGIILGAASNSSAFDRCEDDDSYCFDFSPEVSVGASVAVMSPLLIVGLIAASSGARRRGQARRLSARVELAGGRYGFALMGRF
ncbi:MAG: hypothetical protein IPN77_14260 [Sandaracinaceae bacterium]|jgi:hypothetical protein|nr:hypothetical protein [Sandaracinaceae bacterium]